MTAAVVTEARTCPRCGVEWHAPHRMGGNTCRPCRARALKATVAARNARLAGRALTRLNGYTAAGETEQRTCRECGTAFHCSPRFHPRLCRACLGARQVAGKRQQEAKRQALGVAPTRAWSAPPEPLPAPSARPITPEDELAAMCDALEPLERLPQDARRRAIRWLADRFEVAL